MSEKKKSAAKREITQALIEQVRLRPILYDFVNSADVRSKVNKQKAWNEIFNELGGRLPIPELRKHWKNVRDRYVKVRNQREQHFSSGGGENSAPKYCFYESLYFLKDFCITTTVQKDLGSDLKNIITSKDIEPDPLLFINIEAEADEEERMISGDYIDYTEKMLAEVKERPELYSYELVQQITKSKETKLWTEVARALGNKFTAQNLKHYWGTLLKKYKIYVENETECSGVGNVQIFEKMDFVDISLIFPDTAKSKVLDVNKIKDVYEEQEVCYDEEEIQQDEIDYEEYETLAEPEEEHAAKYIMTEEGKLICLKRSHSEMYTQDDEHEVEQDDPDSEPESKKFQYLKPETKLGSSQSSEVEEEQYENEPICESDNVINKSKSKNSLIPIKSDQQTLLKPTEDEFDLLGKKIAHQIRDIFKKNKRKAREIEIKFLQLMMEAEMSLEEC